MTPTETVPAPRGTAVRRAWLLTGGIFVLCAAVAKLLIHLYAGGNYGYFTDELYYLACGRHLAWGYVDQPPLIAGIAWLGSPPVWRVAPCDPFLSGAGRSGQDRPYGPDCAGNGRGTICSGSCRTLPCCGAGISGHGQPALDERVRAALLDGLRVRRFEDCAHGNQKLWLWVGSCRGSGC